MVETKGIPIRSTKVAWEGETVHQTFTVQVVCVHLSGFLFMRRVSPDHDPRVEEFYCPLCNARRYVDRSGNVVSVIEGKGWEKS